MNEPNDDKIEQLLNQLCPVEPSKQLDQRMKRLFAKSSSGNRSYSIASYAPPLGIAALLVVAFGAGAYVLMMNSVSTPGSSVGSNNPPAVQSVEPSPSALASNQGPTAIHVAESELIDGGFTTTPTGNPVHVLRRESVQRSAWVDPQTKAVVQVEEPSEEVVLVSAETF
jgi:hypothetical protein